MPVLALTLLNYASEARQPIALTAKTHHDRLKQTQFSPWFAHRPLCAKVFQTD